jgi:hypothetical protein
MANYKDHFTNYFSFYLKTCLNSSAEVGNYLKRDKNNEDFKIPTLVNSRDLFLLSCIEEIQKVGISYTKWFQALEPYFGEDDNFKEDDKPFEGMVFSIIDEASMWQRKLLESLLHLINFDITNDNSDYYHFIMLNELANLLYKQKDEEEVFAVKTYQTKAEIKKTIEIIRAIESNISFDRCWYLKKKKSVANSHSSGRLEPSQIFRTTRRLLYDTLLIANDSERTCIGYAYSATYSDSSKRIHFQPSNLQMKSKFDELKLRLAGIQNTSLSILFRCQKIIGTTIEGQTKIIYSSMENRQSDPPKNILVNVADIGDFVIACGYFGKVIEKRLTKYGYEVYHIGFIDEKPGDGIESDWFIPLNVQVLQKKKDLIDEIQATLTKDEDGRKLLEELSQNPSLLEESMEQSVLTIWIAAFKDHAKKWRTQQGLE